MRSKLFIAAICLSLPFMACVKNIAGGSTETTNAAVAGILYQPDGKTPAVGVNVHIRPRKSLADTSGAGLGKRLATMAATDSVVTDSAGRFAFDTTIDTGTYVITSASGNNAVLIDSVTVKNKATTDTLAPDTLKPAGALKGIIKLSEGGDPRKVFVLAFGIDRFARVNADGSFKFSSLAEAKYDLRLISSLDNYGVLDTVGVPVRSADTTNLDTINLPFTGIPTPKGLTISYDTLKQIVTLTWSKADTALVKSYNVYRRNVDSNTVAVRINASPVADTVYSDSTGVQGTTYEYMVAAVNKSATEGMKSTAIGMSISGLYQLIDSASFDFGGTAGEIASSPDGRLVLRTKDRIQVLDSTLMQRSSFNLPPDFGNGFGLTVDDSGRILASNYTTGQVNIYSTNGVLLDSILAAGRFPNILVTGPMNEIYVKTETGPNMNQIRIYDQKGSFVSLFPSDSAPITRFITDMLFDNATNLVILDHSNSTVTIYNSVGTIVNQQKLAWITPHFARFKDGRYALSALDDYRIILLDRNLKQIGRFSPIGVGDFLHFTVDAFNRLIVRNLHSVLIYQKR
jgi:hypothetical protein